MGFVSNALIQKKWKIESLFHLNDHRHLLNFARWRTRYAIIKKYIVLKIFVVNTRENIYFGHQNKI